MSVQLELDPIAFDEILRAEDPESVEGLVRCHLDLAGEHIAPVLIHTKMVEHGREHGQQDHVDIVEVGVRLLRRAFHVGQTSELQIVDEFGEIVSGV